MFHAYSQFQTLQPPTTAYHSSRNVLEYPRNTMTRKVADVPFSMRELPFLDPLGSDNLVTFVVWCGFFFIFCHELIQPMSCPESDSWRHPLSLGGRLPGIHI